MISYIHDLSHHWSIFWGGLIVGLMFATGGHQTYFRRGIFSSVERERD